MESPLTNEDLGYDSFFETERRQLGLAGFSVGRIIAEFRGAYKVKNAAGEYFAKITGKQMFNASSREDYPAVGDWVAISEAGNAQAVIHQVLPRRTKIIRKFGDKNRTGFKDKIQVIAANIDVAFVVESLDRDYNLNRFERYFVLVKNGGIKLALILNKADLIPEEKLKEIREQVSARFPGVDVITTSAWGGDGLAALEKSLVKGKTYCFLGSSGVGKSSLINRLLGENLAETGEVSLYSHRGKHVTTARQMYFLKNGSILIDNPGMREVSAADTSELDAVFVETRLVARACKYRDCTHTHEPGCAVLEAVKSGNLDQEKYANYLRLKKETDYLNMTRVEKRGKSRKFGKFINRAKKDLEKF